MTPPLLFVISLTVNGAAGDTAVTTPFTSTVVNPRMSSTWQVVVVGAPAASTRVLPVSYPPNNLSLAIRSIERAACSPLLKLAIFIASTIRVSSCRIFTSWASP